MREAPPGFSRPEYSSLFDLEARLQGADAAKTVKGLLLQGSLNAAKDAGRPLPNAPKYTAFKDYPAEEGARLNVQVARHLYPDETTQEGLRRLGKRAFRSLSESVLGRVLLGVVGLKLETALRSIPRIFELITRNGQVSLVSLAEDNARFHYQNFCPDFLDCYHVGALEGGLQGYGKTPEIFLRAISNGEAELWAFWD